MVSLLQVSCVRVDVRVCEGGERGKRGRGREKSIALPLQLCPSHGINYSLINVGRNNL